MNESSDRRWDEMEFLCKGSGLPRDDCECTRCNTDIFRFKWICSETEKIEDVIGTLGSIHDYFKTLQEKGYTIDGSIGDDYMEIHPPKRVGYYSVRCKKCREIFYVQHSAVSPGLCDTCDLREDSKEPDIELCVCQLETEELEKRASLKNPDPLVFTELGHRLVRNDELLRAGQVFTRLVELQPDKSRPRIYLGHVLTELDEYEDAVHHLKIATELEPESADSWKYLGIYLFGLSRYRDAENALRKSLEIQGTDPWVWSFLGDVLMETEFPDEAEQCYIISVTADKDHFYGYTGLAKFYIEKGEYKKAKNELLVANRLKPSDEDVLLNLARIKMELDEDKEAELVLRELVTNNPVHEVGWYLLGDILFWTERNEAAERAYSNAVEVDDKYYDAWIALGRLYSEIGKDEDAIVPFQIARDIHPYHEIPHMELLRAYRRLGWEDESDEQVKALLELRTEQQVIEHTIPYDEIDPTIRDIIRELNDLGFDTWGSCSGLAEDHPDREPHKPYVNFFTQTPHELKTIFLLADESSWYSDYGVNGEGAFVRLDANQDEEIKEGWKILIGCARAIAPYYREDD